MIAFYGFALLLIFLFIFITGFHDEGNLIATIITSRSLNVSAIFALAFVFQFLGSLLLGTKVAVNTITSLFDLGKIGEDPAGIPPVVCAAMFGAVVWNIVTWIAKIPSSSSHAMIGGLIGPFLVRYGWEGIRPSGIAFGVLLPLFTSPIVGYVFGFAIFKINRLCFRNAGVGVKKAFEWSQVVTCALINAFQGSNDAQKGMGVVALLLFGTVRGGELTVPDSAVFWSALTISSGLVLGGLKMIKSVGTKIYTVKALHSLSAQTAALAVIGSASVLGLPVSGTQIVNSSILGVGAADRPNAVGWEYAKSMMKAWAITIPASLTLSTGIYIALDRLLKVTA